MVRELHRFSYGALIDARFGGFQGGSLPTRFPERGASNVVNSNYLDLPAMFEGRINVDDIIVEVGCGRGRVINWLLWRRIDNQIIGIELDPEVAQRTAHRLRRHQQVSIVTGDVVEVLPAEGTIFYLYNPFDRSVVERFRDRLIDVIDHRCQILYYNSEHLEAFVGDPRFTITHVDIATNDFDSAVIGFEPTPIL